MAQLGWRFEANLQEAARSVGSSEGPISRLVDHLAVRSRDPDHPLFLRLSQAPTSSETPPATMWGRSPPTMG